jgi:hypothetical protein
MSLISRVTPARGDAVMVCEQAPKRPGQAVDLHGRARE